MFLIIVFAFTEKEKVNDTLTIISNIELKYKTHVIVREKI